MKRNGNVRGEVRVNFLALFASKPHIFMCGALKLSGIVRANFRLNIAIAMLFWSLKYPCRTVFPVVSPTIAATPPLLSVGGGLSQCKDRPNKGGTAEKTCP